VQVEKVKEMTAQIWRMPNISMGIWIGIGMGDDVTWNRIIE
jgi:hypothetical protein